MFNNTTNKYWGEYPSPPENEWDKIVQKDLGKLVILSAIKPELPKPYQPVPDENCNKIIPYVSLIFLSTTYTTVITVALFALLVLR